MSEADIVLYDDNMVKSNIDFVNNYGESYNDHYREYTLYKESSTSCIQYFIRLCCFCFT